VVLQLSQELAGLRRAQRSRSVIEQAKGVLIARLNCSTEQAFEQLTRISQETNTKVAEVAAGLLGLTAPIRPGTAPNPSNAPVALPDQEAARYHLACAAMTAARHADAVAEALLSEGLRPLGAAGLLLAAREPDGTVRLVGSHGLPRGLVSSWQRLPAGLKIGFLAALDEGRPLWLTRDEADRAGLELFGAHQFRACLPLRRGDSVFGVALVLWPDDPGLDLTRQAFVTALAAAAGRRLRQLASAERAPVAEPAAHWLEAVLEALPGSFALLCPITDGSGAIVDWRLDKCSPQARDAVGRTGEQLTGRRLLELHPQLVGSDILRGYEDALRSGRPFVHGPAREPLAVPGHSAATTIWIRAARLGRGILMTWRHDDRRTELLERIRSVREMGPAGWARWNLQTGKVEWAPENTTVLGQARALAIEELPQCAAGADRDRLAKAVLGTLHRQAGADLVFRTGDDTRPATVHVVLEPIADRRGRLTAVTAAFGSDAGPLRREKDRLQPVAPLGRSSARQADARELADTVRELTGKLERLRHEQQTQAIVERAKGMLTVWLGCSIDSALDHLTTVAQRRRQSLLEAAADVAGAALPAGGWKSPVDRGFRPETYLGSPAGTGDDPMPPADADERIVRMRAELQAATDGNGVASILWSAGLREVGAHAVVLGVLEPDGAVRLVGSCGVPAELVGAWRRTPGSLNVAYLRAVATDRPLWISRAEAAAQGYQLLGDGECRACLPLHESNRIFGVASVLWPHPTEPDEDTRTLVTALAEAAGRRLSALLRTARHDSVASAASPAAHWAETIVGALPPCYALLRPVRDRAGEVVDWRFEICSPGTVDVAGRKADEMVGRHLHELYPHVLTAGIADAYRAAMQAGTWAGWGPAEFDIETPSGPVTVTMNGRASKFGDGILVHWRRTNQESLDRQLRLLERATGSGWAEWDLAGGETVWSEATYELLRRDPRRGPVKLGGLHRYVDPEDESLMVDAVRRLTRLKRPVDIVMRLRRHGTVSAVRFAARPVLDEQDGRVSMVRAVFQRHDR
jgi:AmiR/NasT family two-component response regulator